MNEYSKRISATVDKAMDDIATLEFWKELGPELEKKFRGAAHYVGAQVMVEALQLVREEIDEERKNLKPVYPSAEAYFEAVAKEPPEKD